MKWLRLVSFIFLTIIVSSCTPGLQTTNPDEKMATEVSIDQPSTLTRSSTEQDTQVDLELPIGTVPEGALSTESLVYIGAFRLPDDSGGMGWDYSGQGMTYYPGGDPGGLSDGFPGSLFVVGHDQEMTVGEVSIPVPIISRNLDDLNTAETLQSLTDITGGAIIHGLDIPILGIEYLPTCNNIIDETLQFTIGQHFQGFDPSHGWASLDLSDPEPEGLWIFNGYTNYTTNDYLFAIPEDWALENVNGYPLATGRFREGVWGGFGPALYAYSPCEDDRPLEPGSTLTAIQPLLLYGNQLEGETDVVADDTTKMNIYAESDHWMGGAWLTSPNGDAVIFTGTKALGENWYGFANGVVWAYDCAENPDFNCPEVPDYPYDTRGFWAEDYMPAILFFNPEDLARVARGEWQTYEPQPYALMDLSDYFFDPNINFEIFKRDLAGAVAFDRTNGLLYIIERLGDGNKSIIHVFRVGSE